ncbi:MAG TPA: GTP-sensing pleiotropic transcriptional regulator CodY, partial [Trichococcus flocculiformis]|nr:GTP-sensing pleiotropic transcriptional regulator CodY [Trichococcus flocculiformis]
MDELLEKLRRINHMLQKEGGFVTNSGEATALPFTEMASVLGDILRANTYLIDLSGNLLGYSEATDINNTRIKQMLEDKKFPEQYAQNLSALFQTTANIGIESDFTAFPIESRDLFITGVTTIVPIFASGKRLGSLILAR